MFPSNAYVIRYALEADAAVVRRLAALDSQPPIPGPSLLGEIDGVPAAAVSLISGRAVADPFMWTERLVVLMKMRAHGIRAHDARPRLRDRIRAGIRVRRPAVAA
jgi:hypothetical protein